MKMNCYVILFVSTVLLDELACQKEASTTIDAMLQTYNDHLDKAIKAERYEKNFTQAMSEEFQLSLVKKMTDYRLQTVVHGNHSFGRNDNDKWWECVNSKNSKIKELEEEYSNKERECVRTSNSVVTEKKQALRLVAKEVRHWKKGFKYLQNLCKEKHPIDKDDAGTCLVEYMNKDNYDNTIARLLELLEITETEFKSQIDDSLATFDDCLQSAFSEYLSGVRSIARELKKCYERKFKMEEIKSQKRVSCIHFSKLNCTFLGSN